MSSSGFQKEDCEPKSDHRARLLVGLQNVCKTGGKENRTSKEEEGRQGLGAVAPSCLSCGGLTSIYWRDHRAKCQHGPSHSAILFRRGHRVWPQLPWSVRCDYSAPIRPGLVPYKFYSSNEEPCLFSPPHREPEGVEPPGSSQQEGGAQWGSCPQLWFSRSGHSLAPPPPALLTPRWMESRL